MNLRALIGYAGMCLAIAALTCGKFARADSLPRNAVVYQQELTRQARLVWGLEAPVAILGAQIHQESGWNPRALSPVGAQGLAQFMPATAAWMPTIDATLTGGSPYNPKWSLRAVSQYDGWLYSRLKADQDCDRWAMTLSAYNGGLGWVLKDKSVARSAGDSPWLWWDHVERHNAGRSKAAFNENRGYPRRILRTLLPRYQAAGWQGDTCQ